MIILDCSIFIAGTMDDENNNIANDILNRLSLGKIHAIVPKLFFIEAANVVVSNVRKKRITKQESTRYIDLFTNAPVKTDDNFNMKDCFDLAITHELSIYDAIYLELAIRKGCALATLDKKLGDIADKLKIRYKNEA